MIRTDRLGTTLLLGIVLSSLAGCGSDSLRILVTNDDGVAAEGIDAIVEALSADSNNDVTVCAPATNKSGSSDKTIEDDPGLCGTGNATQATTASGYPAIAIDGCPADSVNYALDPANRLYAADSPPHVVISGINEGQNVTMPISDISGTVGAAKTAARDHDVPALASSQGSSIGSPFGEEAEYDYPSGVDAVVDWLAKNRVALSEGRVGTDEIESLNIPSCTAGEIRGLREVPLAPTADNAFKPQDCESTLENPADDAEAFINGFSALSPVAAN